MKGNKILRVWMNGPRPKTASHANSHLLNKRFKIKGIIENKLFYTLKENA